jgi:CRISPR system Cascade subunit CasB
MTPHEPQVQERPTQASNGTDDLVGRLARIITQAARFQGDAQGLGSGEHAALARLDPDGDLRPHQIAALTRALLQAGIDPAGWGSATGCEQWRRWTLIAHGMALAGHDPGRSLGEQLHRAGVAESRVTRLLTTRGEAFRQLLPRLLRLLASKEVAPNWYQLATLILSEGRDEAKAEQIRLHIASAFYRAERLSAEAQPA